MSRSNGLCWPCAHGDHENCAAEQEVCFCPKCWDDEDRCVVGDAHEQAIVIKMLSEGS